MRFPLLKDDLLHQLERFFPIAFAFLGNDDAPEFNTVMRTFSPCEKKKSDHAARASRFDDEMGQIPRLKLLKRQSYGQAGFDLLRHRVLARSA
jgi:hypothetical protein